jgi:hypothetical protein
VACCRQELAILGALRLPGGLENSCARETEQVAGSSHGALSGKWAVAAAGKAARIHRMQIPGRLSPGCGIAQRSADATRLEPHGGSQPAAPGGRRAVAGSGIRRRRVSTHPKKDTCSAMRAMSMTSGARTSGEQGDKFQQRGRMIGGEVQRGKVPNLQALAANSPFQERAHHRSKPLEISQCRTVLGAHPGGHFAGGAEVGLESALFSSSSGKAPVHPGQHCRANPTRSHDT